MLQNLSSPTLMGTQGTSFQKPVDEVSQPKASLGDRTVTFGKGGMALPLQQAFGKGTKQEQISALDAVLASIGKGADALRQHAATGTLTAQQAQQLTQQVAVGRQALARLFDLCGALPQGLSRTQAEARIQDLPLARLGEAERKTATGLLKMVQENLRTLHHAADKVSKPVTLMPDKPASLVGEEGAKEFALLQKTMRRNFQAEVARLVPESLQGGLFKRKLQGDEASRQLHQLAWGFRQLVTHNPEVRTWLSAGALFASASDQSQFVTGLVGRLNLTSGDKATLKKLLSDALASHQSVSTRDLKNLKELGEGATAVTFGATLADQPVVVKMLKQSTLVSSNPMDLYQELRSLTKVHNDPNVPHLLNMVDGTQGLLQERVDGGTLARLNSKLLDTLDPKARSRVALHLFDGAVRALGTLHGQGLVHRDIKPDNLLFDHHSLQAKLIDFGTARLVEHDDLRNAGTHEYKSPQHDGDHMSPGGDIYSLGVTLYHLMGGIMQTREHSSIQSLRGGQFTRLITDAFGNPKPSGELQAVRERFESMPKPLTDLVLACCNGDPDLRPSSRQMIEALNGWSVTPAKEGEAGLKANQLGVLDVLKPDSKWMQGGQDLLAKHVSKTSLKVPS